MRIKPDAEPLYAGNTTLSARAVSRSGNEKRWVWGEEGGGSRCSFRRSLLYLEAPTSFVETQ